ncbi:BA75_00080T0 [Komagataella pastoris]|uniref:BA75_00080T0 n=1 Tax=Komagataella pastoris TaxID=4922 RepID=A0A1B2J7H3_PICPA|nr:BA75_00080T0 [Komagataella pastoris]
MNNYNPDGSPVHGDYVQSNFRNKDDLEKYSPPQSNDPHDRLPTLYEVLNRKTQTPVDLWSFYVYMRDSQSAIDYLDFWLDVIQHLNLCKSYVKGLKTTLTANYRQRNATNVANAIPRKASPTNRSFVSPFGGKDIGNTSRESVGSQKHKSISSSVLLDMIMTENLLEDEDNNRLSSFLKGEATVRTSDPNVNQRIEELKRHSQSIGLNMGASNSNLSVFETQPESREINRISTIKPEMLETFIKEEMDSAQLKNDSPRPENLFVTRADLRSSSRKILYTYFMEAAEKRLFIPEYIIKNIRHNLETEGRDDPEVFEEAKEYVFKAMENEAFPGFLLSNAISNITVTSHLVRLIFGFFFLFVGFWVGYTLIFLNWNPKPVRAVVVIPFFIGAYLLITSIYNIDPVLSILGYGESKATHSGLIKLKEPFVRRLLLKRGLWVLLLTSVIAAVLSIIFALVPGKRL